MIKFKVGDFIVQENTHGKVLRRVVKNSKFSDKKMYKVFAKHGYYPISETLANNCFLIGYKIDIGPC